MSEGSLSSIFKTGQVTPVYKKDNDDSAENYRPVYILSIFGKTSDKSIYTQLIKFFMANGIIHEDQFDFKKGCSAKHAPHKFIDISIKAFDLIIKNVLQNLGFRGTSLSLSKSYST